MHEPVGTLDTDSSVVAERHPTGIGRDSGVPTVRLQDVTKVFDDVTAVDRLSLQIGRGEFFSLLGPSGCGKTTTLRMIGGFETPTAGNIYLDGVRVTDLPAYRRDVNTVFQSYALFPHLNVYDNLAFGLRQRGIARSDIEQRVQDALSLVDLAGFGKRKPRQLSGGQQQRIALARALINRPKVLLLDEPLGALDARLRKHMQLELKQIQQDVGITFIYVTHDQEEALTMSDRLAVMRAGIIEQIGSPQDVYDRPATEFVAGFLGASNLLEANVVESGERTGRVRLDSGEVLSVPAGGLSAVGSRVKVGVRPEKIRLEPARSETPAGWNAVPGTVQVATFVGVSYQYTVEGPGNTHLTVYAQNQGTEEVLASGRPVTLMWLPEHTFVVEQTPSGVEEKT